jgi:excisionase family DNA binding protein
VASQLERTVLPPEAGASTLSEVLSVLEEMGAITVVGAGGVGVVLPDGVSEALREVVNAMSQGQAVTIASTTTVLTTKEAADLLGISRPTLVRLLEQGEIPFTRPGQHRRVALADLTAYQARVRAERRSILDQMTSDAAEDDTYQTINGFTETR